jgi:hypothetical protein
MHLSDACKEVFEDPDVTDKYEDPDTFHPEDHQSPGSAGAGQ